MVFPDDEALLLNLEKAIRERLTEEKNILDRQLIQQYACELSRAETDVKDNKINKQKLAEEKKLWTEVEPATVESPDNEHETKEIKERKGSARRMTANLASSSKPPVGYVIQKI